MKTNSSERINDLKKRYTDKTLSRAERREALKELSRELYKNDPRKPLSLKAQTVISAVSAFIMCVNFFYMGISENMGDGFLDYHTRKTIGGIIIAIMIAIIAVWVILQSQFKQEPNDELSLQNKVKADSVGSAFTIFALLILSYVYFMVLGNEKFVIMSQAAIFFIAGFIMLTGFVNKIVFLILESKDSCEGDEEDE